jgi:hypothetical protein
MTELAEAQADPCPMQAEANEGGEHRTAPFTSDQVSGRCVIVVGAAATPANAKMPVRVETLKARGLLLIR